MEAMLKSEAAARRLGVTVKALRRWDRLYGLHNYRRQLDAALKQDSSHVAGPSNQA